MNKPLFTMEEADNSHVYVRARKRYLEKKGEIHCSFCPYHRKENAEKLQRNWKRATKRKKQYKTK